MKTETPGLRFIPIGSTGIVDGWQNEAKLLEAHACVLHEVELKARLLLVDLIFYMEEGIGVPKVTTTVVQPLG
jgi:hypothetical protein